MFKPFSVFKASNAATPVVETAPALVEFTALEQSPLASRLLESVSPVHSYQSAACSFGGGPGGGCRIPAVLVVSMDVALVVAALRGWM